MQEIRELREVWQKELELLAQVRDELALQMHLARADVKDELLRLENTFQRVCRPRRDGT